jgi:hypothetical protein
MRGQPRNDKRIPPELNFGVPREHDRCLGVKPPPSLCALLQDVKQILERMP